MSHVTSLETSLFTYEGFFDYNFSCTNLFLCEKKISSPQQVNLLLYIFYLNPTFAPYLFTAILATTNIYDKKQKSFSTNKISIKFNEFSGLNFSLHFKMLSFDNSKI